MNFAARATPPVARDRKQFIKNWREQHPDDFEDSFNVYDGD